MASDKLLAEWFWIDRWVGSSAFSLPIDARGLYREMLTQAWRRGARLPNHHDQIRRMTGVTMKEWKRLWPKVKRFWRVDRRSLVNDTQLQVYADAKGRADRAVARAQAGAQARAQALRKHQHKHSSSSAQAPASVSDHQSPVHNPPTPLSAKGGRLTRAQEKRAKEIRAKRMGCTHTPRCPSERACLLAIVAEMAVAS